MKLAYAFRRPNWLIVLYDDKQKPVLQIVESPGESTESKAARLYELAKEMGLTKSLLAAQTYPGAIGPKAIRDAVQDYHIPLMTDEEKAENVSNFYGRG